MTVNIPVMFIAILFGLLQTAYFHFNVSAQSDAEIICDGITFLIAALAFARNKS